MIQVTEQQYIKFLEWLDKKMGYDYIVSTINQATIVVNVNDDNDIYAGRLYAGNPEVFKVRNDLLNEYLKDENPEAF